jgi:hypothetical protein
MQRRLVVPGQPVGPVIKGQAVQGEWRESLGTQLRPANPSG